jgi:hypothetical protein
MKTCPHCKKELKEILLSQQETIYTTLELHDNCYQAVDESTDTCDGAVYSCGSCNEAIDIEKLEIEVEL